MFTSPFSKVSGTVKLAKVESLAALLHSPWEPDCWPPPRLGGLTDTTHYTHAPNQYPLLWRFSLVILDVGSTLYFIARIITTNNLHAASGMLLNVLEKRIIPGCIESSVSIPQLFSSDKDRHYSLNN